MVIGKDGSIYFSGYTISEDFPTTVGAYDETYNYGQDRFICKFDPELKTLLASTFVGGSGLEQGKGLGIDEEGNIYVAGYTQSINFPVTPGSFDESYNGKKDVYVCKFDSELTTLISSTFLGGSDYEGQNWPRIDLVIFENGNVFVTGLTKSVDFPGINNGYDGSFNGGNNGGDIFVAKMDKDLKTLLASTLIGGDGDEWRPSIVLNNEEEVYLCAQTESSSFPTTDGVIDNTRNGFADIFISHFNSDLTELKASTLLGGGGYLDEEALAMRLYNNEYIYLCGYTYSPDFLVTDNVYDNSFNYGQRDGFIAKLNSNLTEVVKSTFLGGNNEEVCRDMVFDSAGNVYLVGNTLSPNFPTTSGSYNENYSGAYPTGDAFISKMDNDLKTLVSSTFIGGTGDDNGYCIALDPNNNIFIGGHTASGDFPVSKGSYDNNYNGGGNDCFVVRIENNLSNLVSVSDNLDKTPEKFNLYHNYPNPFNPETTISFSLQNTEYISMVILDLLGKEVTTLYDGYKMSGQHSLKWNGKNSNNADVSSGIYFCKLTTSEISKTIKMNLLR